MSATFHTEPTPLHERRPDQPSLPPASRPVLATVDDVPPIEAERRLPGGAVLAERRPTPAIAELALVGDVDAFDRGAVIDACTAVGLEGARHLRIDGSGLTFVDLRILEALAKVALHLQRHGGSFELTGLREPYASMWADISADMVATAPATRAKLDDRVVPLHSRESTGAPRGSSGPEPTPMPILRVVRDLGAQPERAGTRPA